MLPNMFMTRFGKRLTEFLSPLLPTGTHISEATLLRAYCAFQYNRIPEANRPPRCSFVLDLDTSNTAFAQCDIVFSRFSIARFILSAIPCYCGDPLGIWRNQERHSVSFTTNRTEPDRDMILANSGNRELCAFSFGFAIVTIKDIYKELCPNTIKTNESQIENESDNPNKYQNIGNNAVLNYSALYDRYADEAAANGIPFLTKRSFRLYVEQICYISQTSPRQLLAPDAVVCASRLIHVLSAELNASNNEIIDFVFNAVAGNGWEGKIKESRFSRGYLDFPETKKEIEHLYYMITGQVSSNELLECLDVLKKESKSKRLNRRNSEEKSQSVLGSTYKRNDTAIEISIAMRLFVSEVASLGSAQCLIILPSVAFVTAWASEPLLNNVNVTFVMTDEKSAQILDSYFSPDSFAAPSPRPEFSFLGFHEWIKEIEHIESFASSIRILIFENRYSYMAGKTRLSNKEKTAQESVIGNTTELILSKLPSDSVLFGFSPDSAMKNFLYLPGKLISSPSFDSLYISDIYIIPRRSKSGVDTGQSSKKKIFWKAMAKDENNALSKCQYLKAATMIVLSSQQKPLYIESPRAYMADPEKIMQADMTKLVTYPASLRAFISGRYLKKDKKKNSPQKVQFTPEICIYYTKRLHKQRNGSITAYKLDVYVHEYKESDVYEATGKKLQSSDKALTAPLSATDADIEEIILKEYLNARVNIPLDPVERKQVEKEDSSTFCPYKYREIRTAIATAYRDKLSSSMVSVGAYIYIHPELDKEPFIMPEYLKTDKKAYYIYELLDSIRSKPLCFITADDIIDVLDSFIPDRSESLNAKILRALYGIFEEIRIKRLLKENIIGKFLADELRVSTALSHLRQAYVKKIFSLSEFRAVYEAILDKLRYGNSEYIGVLIKLLTGLESHIVCALTDSEFTTCRSYAFHQLDIYKQAAGNGSDILTLLSDDDIRRFPCMPILAERIDLCVKSKPGLLVQCTDSSKKGSLTMKPSALDSCAKDIIQAAGIKGVELSISADDNTGLELDLAKYKGDIFRENFRYWILNSGFNTDEIAYLLGNKRPTTFGNYYCDFSNDATQFRLYSKLLRLQSILIADEHHINKPVDLDFAEAKWENSSGPETLHDAINLEITAETDKEIVFNAESLHGVTLKPYPQIEIKVNAEIVGEDK